MSWTEFVLQWSAAQIMEWTGAPKRTVYDWRNGAAPPEWLQSILRPHIQKRHNKDLHATPRKRVGKAER